MGFRMVENANKAQELLQDEVSKIININKQVSNNNRESPSTSTLSSENFVLYPEPEGRPQREKFPDLFKFLQERCSTAADISTNKSDALILVRQYLETPVLDISLT